MEKAACDRCADNVCDHRKHASSLVLNNFVEFGLECLASWKDDSDTFFYARLPGIADEQYRCFVSIFATYSDNLHESNFRGTLGVCHQECKNIGLVTHVCNFLC